MVLKDLGFPVREVPTRPIFLQELWPLRRENRNPLHRLHQPGGEERHSDQIQRGLSSNLLKPTSSRRQNCRSDPFEQRADRRMGTRSPLHVPEASTT